MSAQIETIKIPQALANAYALADCERFPASQMADGLERENTLFYGDFTVADAFGMDALDETFKNAHFTERGYKVATELAVVMNHKCWEWHERMERAHANGDKAKADRCEAVAQWYNARYYEVTDWAEANLKGEESSFFWAVLD